MHINDIIQKSHPKFSSLPNACLEKLLNQSVIKSFLKHEILVTEGQFSKKAFYIVEGMARAYYYVNEKDITDWFAFENEIICPIVSFFSDKSTPHYIQVGENSVVIEIYKDTLDRLCNEFREFESFIKQELTQTMLRQQHRISTILFYTAEQKYLQFLKDYPNTYERIPLMHIASHLGMTLETLSRIRKSVGLI